jgi:hypothetical protein
MRPFAPVEPPRSRHLDTPPHKKFARSPYLLGPKLRFPRTLLLGSSVNRGNPLLALSGRLSCATPQDNVPAKDWTFGRGGSSLLLSLSECKAK